MRRVLAAARTDAETQARHGLYLATGVVLLVSAAALRALPPTGLARLLPAIALQNMAVTGFFFSAALTLLERSEGSGVARAVTPLRAGEHLAARAATLGALAAAQHLVLGIVLVGPRLELAVLIVGALLAAAILALAGFAVAAGRESLGALLLPAVPWLALLLAPMLADVLEWRHPLLWLHPLQGPLALMRAAVAPADPSEIVLGLACGIGWCAAALALARRAYGRAVS